ncbi:MAG: hypothetical protein O3C16_00655, partial [Actinobacteria bacterium]|nr:hypothetical protein [Actinomycetota bacterium]
GSVAYTGSDQEADDSAGGLAVEAQDSSFLAITNHVEVSGYTGVGGLVGYASRNMTVQNSANYGAISASNQMAGGLFGIVRGAAGTRTDVTSFSNYADITVGVFVAGGAIGSVAIDAIANFTNVSNFGEISTNGDSDTSAIGGIIGTVGTRSSINFDSVRNVGTISATGRIAGGLIGQVISGPSSITNSVNEGPVSGPGGRLGGFIGEVSGDGIEVSASTNSGPISSTGDNNGGIIGRNSSALSLSGVVNEGAVAGEDYTGGLIGMHTGPGLVVSGSQNVGAVSGTDSVGGLAGVLNGSGVATLSDVANLASVSGSEKIGGLVGSTNMETRFVRAKNEGSVQATSNWAGGLVGFADEDTNNVSIELSFNSGTVTIADSNKKAGGLLGVTDGVSYSIIDSYNSGRIVSDRIGPIVGWDSGTYNEVLTRVAAFPAPSQATTEDGLVVGFTSDVTATAVYTFEASTLVSSSTIAELKSASTYTGWDFDSVWAFGGCDLNNGYPVLRWAHAGVTFFDQSCGVNSSSSPVVSSGGSGGSTPAPSRTPTAYSGPMLDAHKVVVQPGTANTVLGTRLQTIHTVTIDGLSATLVILTSTSLTITIPSSLNPGTYDLVVYSAHGKLTVNAKYLVVSGAADQDPEPSTDTGPEVEISRNFGVLLGFQWSARFIGNSRDLNQSQVRGVSESLEGYPAATTVVCWGYTAETTPGDWAIEHATERAESLCDAVAGLREDVKLYVRVRFGQSKFAAMRATMQFWESKQPI